jgi:glycosyltransferase involved in cell wall biosynthesis
MPLTRSPDLAVLLAELPMGGVGKMRVNLVNEIARRGYKVDLVLAHMDGPYIGLVSPAVRFIRIPTSHAITGIPGIAAYMLRTRPRVMLSQRIRMNLVALRAHALVRSRTRMFVTVNVNMSQKLAGHSPRKRQTHLAQLRRYFPRNDGIIAVSHGVAEDTAQLIGWPVERIHVAPNPTVTPELVRLAAAPLDHPWFAPGSPPVILGVGRLMPQKDFPSLIRGFAKLRATRSCRLVILGEGPERPRLESLAAELGLASEVALPGFVVNPYAYMAKAGLFVLSSLFEGSPNALTEALAVGTPLVSTDCPNGPREILEGGRHGPLVPVGDVEALAAAMATTLDHPPDRTALQQAAQRYTVERSATAYIEALGLGLPSA